MKLRALKLNPKTHRKVVRKDGTTVEIIEDVDRKVVVIQHNRQLPFAPRGTNDFLRGFGRKSQ